MCGISGIVNLDSRPLNFNLIYKMTEAQKHRGPDDQGFVGFALNGKKIHLIDTHETNPSNNSFPCQIGFNRLSILDLSINGRQPMLSYDQKIAIAYNGETYNAFDFKNVLEKKGYKFRSKTDTEVLLYLYLEFGIEKMLELINGMFAFCIVDLNKNKLFLARDHAGIKPLYWYKNNNTILFASEIKAFLQHPGFNAQVEKKHLHEFQFYNYCTHDRTLFKNVLRIPQGHYLEISLEGENLIKYYEPPFTNNNHLSKNDAIKELEEVLKKCIKSQLISDVKVGCQLSGGIDSSLITTFANEHFKADMDTFSIIMENVKFSEEKYIDQVIKKINPKYHKFLLTPDYFANNFEKATWHYDEPLMLPQTLGFKKLAEETSEHVTVLLSGEGSDELMGGYRRYFDLAYRLKNLDLIRFLSTTIKKGNGLYKNLYPAYNPTEYFLLKGGFYHHDLFTDFNSIECLDNVLTQRKQLIPDDPDLLKNLRYYETRAWLGATLMIQDKMTMTHSIENRVPFTDKRMFDLLFSLPSVFFNKSKLNPYSFNNQNTNTKILLKKVGEKYFNKDFIYRDKIGFAQPLSDYMAYPKMMEIINDKLLPEIKNRGIYNYQMIKKAWDAFQLNGNNLHLNLLWNSFCFEMWAQLFIDRKLIA